MNLRFCERDIDFTLAIENVHGAHWQSYIITTTPTKNNKNQTAIFVVVVVVVVVAVGGKSTEATKTASKISSIKVKVTK